MQVCKTYKFDCFRISLCSGAKSRSADPRSYGGTELRSYRAYSQPVSQLGPRRRRLLPDVIAAYFGAVSVRPAAPRRTYGARGTLGGGGGGTRHW